MIGDDPFLKKLILGLFILFGGGILLIALVATFSGEDNEEANRGTEETESSLLLKMQQPQDGEAR